LLFAVLFVFEFLQNCDYFRRQLDEAYRVLGLGGVGVNPLRLRVIRGALNMDYASFKVNVVPFKTEHLPSAHTAVNIEREECAPFDRCGFKNF